MGSGDYRNEYQASILSILREQTPAACVTLGCVLRELPIGARSIRFGVFPDSVGMFDVVISLEGEDPRALNQAIQNHRTLFCLSSGGSRLRSYLMSAPDIADLSIEDMIVDIAAIWISELWEAVAFARSPVPGLIYGDDGYGTSTPYKLDIADSEKRIQGSLTFT